MRQPWNVILFDLGSRLLPVAVKPGLTIAEDAFHTLRWWAALAGNVRNRQCSSMAAIGATQFVT